jgi:hypothetical protein
MIELRYTTKYIGEPDPEAATADVQEHLATMVAAGWQLQHFGLAVDDGGGQVHGYIWRRDSKTKGEAGGIPID